MKKWWMAVLFMMLLLAACGTETTTDTSTQGSDSEPSVNEETEVTEETTEENELADEQQVLTLYKSNANADQTIPFEQVFDGTEEELVPFIFSTVNQHDVELLEYIFEGDSSLELNLGDNIYSIQGSAGADMFVQTLVRSYFENYPALQQVTFIFKGSYESILDHMNIGVPYVREDFDM